MGKGAFAPRQQQTAEVAVGEPSHEEDPEQRQTPEPTADGAVVQATVPIAPKPQRRLSSSGSSTAKVDEEEEEIDVVGPVLNDVSSGVEMLKNFSLSNAKPTTPFDSDWSNPSQEQPVKPVDEHTPLPLAGTSWFFFLKKKK